MSTVILLNSSGINIEVDAVLGGETCVSLGEKSHRGTRQDDQTRSSKVWMEIKTKELVCSGSKLYNDHLNLIQCKTGNRVLILVVTNCILKY